MVTALTEAVTWAADAMGWSGVAAHPFPADASSRSYTRLTQGGQSAILMERGGDVARFAHLAKALSAHGLSAPAIHAVDVENARLLLEDLGQITFAQAMDRAIQPAQVLYDLAVDVVLTLRHMPLPAGLTRADATVLADMISPVFDYAAHVGQPVPAPAQDELRGATHAALGALSDTSPVLILRDYHVENLMWLPDRVEVQRAGLLDFQDALSGHPAYDLASLVTDVRRTVPPDVMERVLARYAMRSGIDLHILRRDVAILGAQRNLRILGVFTRLAAAGKPGYLKYLPMVWHHVDACLSHPDLADWRHIALRVLPTPRNKATLP